MRFTFLLTTFSIVFFSHAQDMIVTDKNDVLEVKVLNVSSEKIEYKRFDYLEGPKLSIDMKSVKKLVYENGTEENLDIFKTQTKKPQENQMATNPYFLGVKDADQIYSSGAPAFGSAISTALFWPAGLVTSIVLASVKPKAPIVSPSGSEYLSDPLYIKGYRDEAHKKKKRGVWTGFGVGTIVVIVLSLAVSG